MYHQLEIRQGESYPFVCTVCGIAWKHRPRSSCLGMFVYRWQQAPEHLKTYTQLRARHLKPYDRNKPDGCLKTRKRWIYLYDERQALSRRQCTERQRQALRQAWHMQQEKYACRKCRRKPMNLTDLCRNFAPGNGYCVKCWEMMKHEDRLQKDRELAIKWARSWLEREDWAIIDTETTALDGAVIEIAIVAPDGSLLFHSLVNPECPITSAAQAIHGITDDMVAGAPRLWEIWPDLLKALEGRTWLLAYNAEFDRAVLSRGARCAGLPELSLNWGCIMLWYAQYCGEWSWYWCDYTWQKLPGAGHRAQDDAIAALKVIEMMAARSTVSKNDENFEKDQQIS